MSEISGEPKLSAIILLRLLICTLLRIYQGSQGCTVFISIKFQLGYEFLTVFIDEV